jgi:hypothetical protein
MRIGISSDTWPIGTEMAEQSLWRVTSKVIEKEPTMARMRMMMMMTTKMAGKRTMARTSRVRVRTAGVRAMGRLQLGMGWQVPKAKRRG